jgi:16S rRNA (guanine966-N2)-methyltransferase
VQLDELGPHAGGGHQLALVGIDEQADLGPAPGQPRHDALQAPAFADDVEAALGRHLLAVLGHQAHGRRPQAQRDLDHLALQAQLQVQARAQAAPQRAHVVVLDVAPVHAQVRRDPARAGALGRQAHSSGSGKVSRRACRSVATWSMLTCSLGIARRGLWPRRSTRATACAAILSRCASSPASSRGRHIEAPAGDSTRPMLDRVREALFGTLGERVLEARVLDLYAGSGSLGLEALSRGAAYVHFVEQQRAALDTLRANIEALGVQERVRVVRADALSSGRRLESEERFQLVFFDPPYRLLEEPRERAAPAGRGRRAGRALARRARSAGLPRAGASRGNAALPQRAQGRAAQLRHVGPVLPVKA